MNSSSQWPGSSFQNLVQLQLQADRQVVGHDPIGQFSRADLMVARREQDFTGTLVEAVLDQLGYRPVVVLSRTDDELHLIVVGQQRDIFVSVASDLARSRRLEVENLAYARVDP